MRLMIVAAMAAGGLLASMQHASAFTGECLLQVEGKNYIDGPCDIDLERGGSFTIAAPTRRFPMGYLAIVRVERKGVASGKWNEEEGARQAYSPLGTLTPQGACWQNAQAKVCAWKPGTRSQDSQQAIPVSEPTGTTPVPATASPNQSAPIVAQGANTNPMVLPQAPNGDEPVVYVQNRNYTGEDFKKACVYGLPDQDFDKIRKRTPGFIFQNEINYRKINLTIPSEQSLDALYGDLLKGRCLVFMPASTLRKFVEYARNNRNITQISRSFIEEFEIYQRNKLIALNATRIQVSAVLEENAFRLRQEKLARDEAERKAAEERKEAEARLLAEQERLRKEADERQEAARKEEQARHDFIAGYRGNGSYWFLFAKVAVPLNRMCVVDGDALDAVNSYATRQIAAKVAKADGGPDFTNLYDMGFQVVKRPSFDGLISSMNATSHSERCDFAVAPFDDVLALVSARPNDIGAILARPFVFTRAEAHRAEKDAQAEVARKREEQQRAADAEAARQEAQRLRDEAEKRRAAEQYEARKEARRKQDAEEQRVAALNAELERIKQQEAKELAEREAVKRAEQEKRDGIRREREAKERAEREAAMRVEATKREHERIRQEQQAKERAEREAAQRAEAAKAKRSGREVDDNIQNNQNLKTDVVKFEGKTISASLECRIRNNSSIYLIKYKGDNNKDKFDIFYDGDDFDKGHTSESQNRFEKETSTYISGMRSSGRIVINRTTLEAYIESRIGDAIVGSSGGQCYEAAAIKVADKIKLLREAHKSKAEIKSREEEEKKNRAISDRKI